jgi:hypothetical protein
MTSEDSARDELATATRARLDRLAAELHAREPQLARGHYDQVRSATLGTAVLALQYARDTVARVIGDFEADATGEISTALDRLVEQSPQPWGDSALHDLGNITERSARLLADIWMLGRLTAAVDPQSWSTDVLVQQCLQVVAETHLAGKLRAELDGLFGETDEPR